MLLLNDLAVVQVFWNEHLQAVVEVLLLKGLEGNIIELEELTKGQKSDVGS